MNMLGKDNCGLFYGDSTANEAAGHMISVGNATEQQTLSAN